MSTVPKNLPRFLPTLTEVIDPASVALQAPPQTPDVEALVSTVMARLGELIDSRIQEELQSFIQDTITEHMLAWRQRLRTDLDTEMRVLVQQAVTEALAPASKA